MELRRLRYDNEAALRRYSAELWLPYHRELAETVGSHDLADWSSDRFVDHNVQFTHDVLEQAGHRGWVGVIAADDHDSRVDDRAALESSADLADPALELVGHMLTSVDECPDPFDRPDRLVIGDIYLREPYRGTGVADRFVERAVADARDHGCAELRLDVDADNERALTFYTKQGFEPYRKQLTLSVDNVRDTASGTDESAESI